MTADTIGGVWTYALELTRALQNFDIQICLATMGKKLSAGQREDAEHLPNLMLRESRYALEWMDHPWMEIEKAGRWLLELEREVQPELIHLNNYAHGSLPWSTPVLVAGHSCVLSWWKAVKKEEIPYGWTTYAERVKKGLRHADYVVGVTQHMLDCLDHYYGPFSSSGVIHNARDKAGFHTSAKEPVIFSMGRLWDEGKNIRALETIADRLSWPVYVAGEDHEQLSANTHNLNPLGTLSTPEVAEWLSKTSIYVMPARYEPFGLSVLEAALSGCALVVGDIPSFREVWDDAAVYADPDDPDELEYRIMDLINHPAKREHMAGQALKRAQHFSPEHMARQYISVYQKLLKAEQVVIDDL